MAVKEIDRFAGTLLGVMVGDALGRPAKGHAAEDLLRREKFGEEMIGGFYTEDTEMAITVTESLLAQGGLDPDALAERLGQDLNPMRGYNPGLLEVLYKLQQGLDWRDANRVVFEEGSYGVGGSCRAAPIGLFYHDDLELLVEAAATSARITHAHPMGEAGAVTVALVVALALRELKVFDIFAELRDVLPATGYGDFVSYLDPLDDLLDGWPDPPDVVAVLGNRLTVQQCVPAALYSLLRYPESLEQALVFAVNLGGDADTIAALTGAFAGAYFGQKAIPARWLNVVENNERGRDEVIALAGQLYSEWQRYAGGD
jgi:poly(ADP-ribose) glycohydrolase ARH3